MPPKKRGRGKGWTRVKKGKKTTPLSPKEQREAAFNRYLKTIYYNPRHPASFKGPGKVHQAIREEGRYRIGLSYIRRWLQEQENYSVYKPLVRKFERQQVRVTGLYDQYDADLADMQKLARKNDDYTFLLVVIDVFSRYLWVEPLKGKADRYVVEGFKNIFRRGKKPRRLRTDRGVEFTGVISQQFFNEENIEHWTAHNDEIKAHFAERVIRTLKNTLWASMRKRQEYRYIDVLQDIVHSYNHTEHRSTGLKPAEVTTGHVERRLWWHLYKPKRTYAKARKRAKPRYLFKVGDHVRVSHSAKTFQRAYDEKWSKEIFMIAKPFERQGIKKYRVTDIEGEDVSGSFYESELQRVKYSDQRVFEIEKEITSVGKGRKRRTLVKWVGWPPKFNSWISEQQRLRLTT